MANIWGHSVVDTFHTSVSAGVVGARGKRVLRTAEFDMPAGCVAEGVLTLCLFPVMVAVAQPTRRSVQAF